MNKRMVIALALAVALVLTVLVGLGVWVVKRDSRQDLSIAEILASASQNGGYASEALQGMQDETVELCAEVNGCIEGYESPTVQLLRFSSKESAAVFASSSSDVHQSDWIVIVYVNETLTDKGRTELETLVDEMWTSG